MGLPGPGLRDAETRLVAADVGTRCSGPDTPPGGAQTPPPAAGADVE